MKQIAFIGIGLMGLPMAKNLLNANYPLKVFNRSTKKAEVLKEYKAIVAKSIKEVVTGADVIITMLTDDSAVDTVMKSKEFLDNLKSGSTVIDMSSVKPETAKFHGTYLLSKNINYLDAPVSGGTVGRTFACIIQYQFQRFVSGDRYFFANPSTVGSKFYPSQISALKNVKMRDILCKTSPTITQVQPEAFKAPTAAGTSNAPVTCSNAYNLDINIFFGNTLRK